MTAALAIDSHPDANVLTAGFRTPLLRNGENAEAIGICRDITLRAFSPRTGWQVWLSDDIAFMMLRLDRIGRMDRRQRDQSALRAEFFWDDDRRLLAAELGDRLKAKPEKTAANLRATPQGCDWLLQRWGWLQAVLDAGKAWDEPQRSIALDLLGVAPEFRESATHRLVDPARLVRDEVADLKEQKARVAESDALERSLAMADMIDPATAEYRSLRSYERRTHQRIKWAMAMMEMMPKYAQAHPEIVEARQQERQEEAARRSAEAAVAATRSETPSPLLPQPCFNPTPLVLISDLPPLPHPSPAPPPAPAPAPSRSQRPDPAKLRAKTRSNAARQRREDRPDR